MQNTSLSNIGEVTMTSIELVVEGNATNEQATVVAHFVIKTLMRSITNARNAQVNDRDSYDKAWNDMQATRHIAQTSIFILRNYPELAESIQSALAVSAYAEALILGVLNDQFVNSLSVKSMGCKTYVVKSNASGLIKIGKSINPESRIKSLETGAGIALKTIAILNGDRERELHQMFSGLRVFGEWFRDDGSIAEFACAEKCHA